jgi:hypothetical protein
MSRARLLFLVFGLVSLVGVQRPARAEGSTLTTEKIGACAVLTAADAQRFSNVPMEVQAGAPGKSSPGRSCAYRPVRSSRGRATVQLRLLDAGEWSRLKPDADTGKLEIEGVAGIGDEAYVARRTGARRAGAVVLFVRRGRAQFSVRFAGAGVQLTDPMKQLARNVAGRL